ncbi:hypothetical protein SAMN05443574_11741 [Haloarcula vallismortis]|uniref:Uncharacterized protein n=1 Tax=Haloarcula vallismortis TaxID=28442 RepID=A0A1H2ZLT3_HALVA|nr:hypothetical protein [Haloarcula vallismortis]SDX18335.1 hypothetical protein SAMN05443574_11741 [Haloarcula vallismortis]
MEPLLDIAAKATDAAVIAFTLEVSLAVVDRFAVQAPLRSAVGKRVD